MYNFDSDEEKYFSWYLDELTTKGIILEWQYHPKEFTLSSKVQHEFIRQMKKINKPDIAFLMHPHEYKADFMIYWNPGWEGRIFMTLDSLLSLNYPFIANIGKSKNPYSVIDVKGGFVGPRNNSGVTFPLNQKWVYQKYKIYVQKIIPQQIFKETFCPDKYRITNVSGKARKIKFQIYSLSDYMERFTLNIFNE
jgi:hypothetical protein